MYYKLSNTAAREEIEFEFDSLFRYPKLYEPVSVINGLEETSLPIITADDQNSISFGIWGLLPERYNDDWKVFQNTINTLNIPSENITFNHWTDICLKNRRCLVLITGFFASYLHEGDIYPYYVYSRDKKPFSVAGIYNQLEDGFVTVGIIIVPPNGLIKKIQNIDFGMPLALDKEKQQIWLGNEEVDNLISEPCNFDLIAHPIAKELFNKGISYDSMLEEVEYEHIPKVNQDL